MQLRKAVLLAPLLAGFVMLPSLAGALPKQAEQALGACLKGKVNPDDAAKCVGHYSDPCAAKAEKAAPIPQIAEQSQCLLDEATAWGTYRDRAVQSWKKDNGTSFSATIGDIATASQSFAALKCSIFRNTDQFGQTGMALEAECLRDEAARTAVFISYGLD